MKRESEICLFWAILQYPVILYLFFKLQSPKTIYKVCCSLIFTQMVPKPNLYFVSGYGIHIMDANIPAEGQTGQGFNENISLIKTS